MIVLTLNHFRAWIAVSPPTIHRFLVLFTTNELCAIKQGFESIRRVARTWDEVSQRPLLMASCLLYLIHYPMDVKKQMRGLLSHVLGLIDTQDPISVHGHVEYLLCEFRKLCVLNDSIVYQLAMGLVRVKPRGVAIGTCLLWSILNNMLPLEVTMHRYREFKELAMPIAALTTFKLPAEHFYLLDLLMKTMNRLLDITILHDNSDLKQFGYPAYFFQMRHIDVDTIQRWATMIMAQTNLRPQYINQATLANEMLLILNRIRTETPELIEEEHVPKGFPIFPDDTYSDVED